MTRIPVNPELLTWARERAGLESLALRGAFPNSPPMICASPMQNDFWRTVHE